MKKRRDAHYHRTLSRNLLTTAIGCILAGSAVAAPTYTVTKVLVAEDQYQGEKGVSPAPLYKPHETDASRSPKFWISSNERGEEEGGEEPDPATSKAGITIFKNGNNAVLSQVEIEDLCLPVINPNGTLYGCAPSGAEGHPRHPHGIDIDEVNGLAYQVVEHSGLQWNADRTGFDIAESTDTESGLMLVYDISDPKSPQILWGYVLGHAAEEPAVNENNDKVYVGNHEPSTSIEDEAMQCFVSVIDPFASPNAPYAFIDLDGPNYCVQGIEVDEGLNQVFGTTHIGEEMYAFNSDDDSIAYWVNIRGPFDAQVQAVDLPEGGIPEGSGLHMHDLAVDPVNHRAYQTIHTLAPLEASEDEETAEEEGGEVSGRWVAAVDVDPVSPTFQDVTIIDLSNGQTAADVPSHEDNEDDINFEDRFVHAHFIAVDPTRKALLVSGEHTGNLGVVDIRSDMLEQVVAISRPIPGCERVPEIDPETGEELPLGPAEPHVHGVNIQQKTHTVYVSDEGEDCFYESVTILK